MKQCSKWVAVLLLAAVGSVMASSGGLRVEQAWARATPVVAPVAGGFLIIANDGGKDDRLLRVESDIAQRVEIHQMRNDAGVMRMRQVTEGLPIAAHGRLVMAPGGYHLMLIQPKRALLEGGHFDATLVFQRAGRVKATFQVRAMGAGAH
ncbi:copper chaperone PCu(A)C [Thermomonas paludicola]|uniref:copper chaperone PCu(A)C n=1 Tax=Thermomonas paludicola TaxID=2884874 RepID=UPI002113E065|nr:copper chaperone PCu(A)C [Thermomonas paludicola]